MILAMPAVDLKDPDYYAAVLGGSILGDSDGSRLYWNIYQKGLAESASASIWAMEGTGILLMQANSTPEEAPRVLKLLRAELDSFLNDGVYEDEVRRALCPRDHSGSALDNNATLISCRCSSVVELSPCKRVVKGSSPFIGSFCDIFFGN